MKKKISAFFAVVFLALIVINSSVAEPFTLRNGIEWRMTKEQVLECLRSEPDFDDYEVTVDEVFFEDSRKAEPEKPDPYGMWFFGVGNTSLGEADEDVELVFFGTYENGLDSVIYEITVLSDDEEQCYERAKDLAAQLSEKYGAMDVTDQWDQKEVWESKPVWTYVTLFESRKVLSDGTKIYLHLDVLRDQLVVYINYQCADKVDRTTHFDDDSLQIESDYSLQ